MERKNSKRQNSFRPLFGFRRISSVFLGRQNGFTLVELLIVVGVLSILVTAILLVLNPFTQVQKANDAKRKSDLSQVAKSLETYYQDNARYPAHTASYKITRLDGSEADWNTQFPPYMSKLPKDPKGLQKYVYFASANGQSYWLYASLERSNDPQMCNGGNPCTSITSNGLSQNVCGGTCNFAITSSNVSP